MWVNLPRIRQVMPVRASYWTLNYLWAILSLLSSSDMHMKQLHQWQYSKSSANYLIHSSTFSQTQIQIESVYCTWFPSSSENANSSKKRVLLGLFEASMLFTEWWCFQTALGRKYSYEESSTFSFAPQDTETACSAIVCPGIPRFSRAIIAWLHVQYLKMSKTVLKAMKCTLQRVE